MSEEIERILNGIGWQVAKMNNKSLFFQAWEPSRNGGLYFASKPDAKLGLEKLDAVAHALAELPEYLRLLLGDFSRQPQDWEKERIPMEDFELGLLNLIDYAHREKDELWSGDGPSTKHAARNIAREMAEIYVLGMGKKPTSGSRPDKSSEPSTRFTRAVKAVFHELKIDAHFKAPCEHAIAHLNKDCEKRYKTLLKMGENGSPFRFAYRGKESSG